MRNKRTILATLIIALLLIADQIIKVYFKLNWQLGEQHNMFGPSQGWARFYFIENEGMAFGLKWGEEIGKYILTFFRIIAVGFIINYLSKLIKREAPFGLIIAIALVFAGAAGNIVDSVFYGVIFSESFHSVAEFMPESGGYAPWFQGKVVDMFYFPMIQTEKFTFFNAIFNLADVAISVGVGMIAVFYKRYFKKTSLSKKEDQNEHPLEVVEETSSL